MTEELPLCGCGCGKPVTKKGNKFIHGHGLRGRKFSLNHRLKMTSSAKKRWLDSISRKKQSDIAKKRWSDPEKRKELSKTNLKEKNPLPNGSKITSDSGMATNKNCASFLGCYIAEQVLSKIFKNVKIMPYGNSGYDFICGKGLKIDVKSSTIGYHNGWGFNIKKNKKADFFILLAFDNRNDLNPIHLWLIPGKDINHLTSATICESTIKKWSQYEQPLDKVIKCCNNMRN